MIGLENLLALKIDTKMLSQPPVILTTSLYAANPVPKRVIGPLLSKHDEFEFIQRSHYQEIIVGWSIGPVPFFEPNDYLVSMPSDLLLWVLFFNRWLTTSICGFSDVISLLVFRK